MKPFATYCLRIDADRIHQLKDHWEHHKPLCLNGVVCLDFKSYTQENISIVESLGLKAVKGVEDSNFDRNLSILEKEAAEMEGDWFLSLDSDEYIPPFEFSAVWEASLEPSVEWLHGWICDRVAEGGIIPTPPENFKYSTLSQAFPVMTDATKSIQKSETAKCFASKKPDIGQIHWRKGTPHRKWFRVDHYKWFGECIPILEGRTNSKWFHQFNNVIQHFKENNRLKVENCLSNMWDYVHGWFDFWDLYKKVINRLDGPATVIEVGVWQGKSSLFFSQYAMAKGLDYELWLVDRFRGCEVTASHLCKISPHLNKKSSFIHNVATTLFRNGASDRCNFVQADSLKASRMFDDESVDFVFIDADHSYEAVKADIAVWFPKVKKGGFIGGHDYNHNEVWKAVNEFFAEKFAIDQSKNSWLVEK